jgi:hypothetical protein
LGQKTAGIIVLFTISFGEYENATEEQLKQAWAEVSEI